MPTAGLGLTRLQWQPQTRQKQRNPTFSDEGADSTAAVRALRALRALQGQVLTNGAGGPASEVKPKMGGAERRGHG